LHRRLHGIIILNLSGGYGSSSFISSSLRMQRRAADREGRGKEKFTKTKPFPVQKKKMPGLLTEGDFAEVCGSSSLQAQFRGCLFPIETISLF
jgi:hypothetical protein